MLISIRSGWCVLGLVVLACSLFGCDQENFSSGAGPARAAVETALSAWRDGKAIDQVEASPSIRVVDSSWREGLKIESFEIVGEQAGDDATHLVSVRLKPAKSNTEREAVYVVHGRDPIWVYLEDDYRRMLHMDDNPSRTRARVPRKGRGG